MRPTVAIVNATGITFLDNCWDYHDGKSEERMGKALRDGRRQKVFLMTKLDGRTRKAAAQQIDQSLKRLQTDHIDLMQIHEVIRMEDADRCFAPGGAVEALKAAQQAGKIRFVGFTGHKDPAIHLRMLEVAAQHGFHFDTVQMPLNLLDAHVRSFARRVIPVALQQGVAILGMKSMGDGLVLQSKAASAPECLRYAMNLPVSTVITGIERQEILDQALRAAREFQPFERPALAACTLTAAAVTMLALVHREMPRQVPLIALDLLRDGSFRISVIASVCCFIGQSAAMVSLPFYLQHGLGQDALRAGLLITPWPLSVALVAPSVGRLVSRVSGAWLCALGGVLLALGLAGAALWPLHGRPLVLIPFCMLCGVGFGLFQVPNNRNMFLSAPRARSGAAGGLQGTARLTGQTLGGVIMTLLLAVTPIDRAPRLGLGVAAVLTLTAGLVSMLRAPPTPDPPRDVAA